MITLHEFSTAQAIINTVMDAVKKYSFEKILEINLEIGEFTLLNYSQLRFALKTLSKDTVVEGAKIIIKTLHGALKCAECGYEGRLNKRVSKTHYSTLLPQFQCPNCQSMKTDIIGGREMNIKNIKLKLKT
ncbi:MAG: hydrogenase maturation nickel metallochaperone HypA [Candidatus Odinarchaeota archaeon]